MIIVLLEKKTSEISNKIFISHSLPSRCSDIIKVKFAYNFLRDYPRVSATKGLWETVHENSTLLQLPKVFASSLLQLSEAFLRVWRHNKKGSIALVLLLIGLKKCRKRVF